MKISTALAGYAITLLLSISAGASCTQQQAKSVLNTAMTASQIACALEHATLGEPDIARLCQFSADLAPVLRTLIGSHRAAVLQSVAASHPMVPDAKRCP